MTELLALHMWKELIEFEPSQFNIQISIAAAACPNLARIFAEPPRSLD